MAMPTDRLMIVGAEAMGTQLARQASWRGGDCVVVDVENAQLDRARSRFDEISTVVNTLPASVLWTTKLDIHVPSCGWAVDAVIEDRDAKRAAMDQLAEFLPPSAGIATNSSELLANEIAGDASYASRILNMHFFHPVTQMDLIEIVPGQSTDAEILQRSIAWPVRVGRHSIVLRRAVWGFLVNRILGAAIDEAFSLLAAEVASAEEINSAVERRFRWPMGPFRLADFSGLDILYATRRRRSADSTDRVARQVVDALEPLIMRGRLGRKSGSGFYAYGTHQ